MEEAIIKTEEIEVLPRGSKTIRVSYDKAQHLELINDNEKFKVFLDHQIEKHPELFPEAITNGYTLEGKTRRSTKLDNLQFQRIRISKTKEIFSVYPSFIMPCLIAYTDDVDKALMLRKHDVPYSTLVYVFGRDEMYWYRVEQAFSRCSIVGTTVKKTIKSLKTLLQTKNKRS